MRVLSSGSHRDVTTLRHRAGVRTRSVLWLLAGALALVTVLGAFSITARPAAGDLGPEPAPITVPVPTVAPAPVPTGSPAGRPPPSPPVTPTDVVPPLEVDDDGDGRAEDGDTDGPADVDDDGED